jgi:hypothetical protein
LLEALEKSYLIVRYGNGVQAWDHEVWELFCRTAEKLFDALSNATGLRFLRPVEQ